MLSLLLAEMPFSGAEKKMTAENQRKNARLAAEALAPLYDVGHEVVITHGNGPQVGLLALQGAAYEQVEAIR